MHEVCVPAFIHRDLKSPNIVLSRISNSILQSFLLVSQMHFFSGRFTPGQFGTIRGGERLIQWGVYMHLATRRNSIFLSVIVIP